MKVRHIASENKFLINEINLINVFVSEHCRQAGAKGERFSAYRHIVVEGTVYGSMDG